LAAIPIKSSSSDRLLHVRRSAANASSDASPADVRSCTRTCGLSPLCADVDECEVNNGGCDQHANCSNTVGGFECTCRPGFTGDGLYCRSKLRTYLYLIHDLLFLPISTIESGVSLRVITHSPIRAWLVHASVHTSSQARTTQIRMTLRILLLSVSTTAAN